MRGIISSVLSAGLALMLVQAVRAQNISIQLTPQGMPIQISAQGGSFNYIIAATNSGTTPQQAAVWCMVTLPDSSVYGPVLGPVIVTLNPGQTLDRLRTQNVPAGAPEGNYAFNAHIGIYPDSIWDSDSFPFEKTMQGGELWVARYNGPSNLDDYATAMAVDAAGNIYVTGTVWSNGTYDDYGTVKYDSNGNQIWAALYNGPVSFSDYGSAIGVDLSENVYVTGSSMGIGTSRDFATLKYDSNGNQLWIARYDGSGDGYDYATSLAVDAAGNVYVTGCSNDSLTYDDYATIKYDTNGNQVWVARYTGPASANDWPSEIALDADGNVFVTGRSVGESSGPDYATIKYDGAGNQLWVARYTGPYYYSDLAQAIAVDDSGNVYVTGYSEGLGTGRDYATIKYDSDGNQIWLEYYSSPGNHFDEGNDIAVDAAGNVYVTGFSAGIESISDFATIKYDAQGHRLWVARYDGLTGQSAAAHALALDANANVYVAGSILATPGTDYATVMYDTDGNQIWAATYDGPGNSTDEANALVLDAFGGVYVTGSSDGAPGWQTNYDYATIKYSGGNIANWMPVEATVLGQPLPQECRLEPNYPNPFNSKTVARYELRVPSVVSLRVYDTAGRLVATLVDGWRSAGTHELTFEAGDLPSGMYFAKLEVEDPFGTGEYVGVQKLVLVK